ncbi:MAG: hypothetical protein HRT58_05255 [Crocinitomicaceae bacterium]|nr:hypothetical protein [Flavobacteriales bacterium]NQZ35046.1 hypothetical protein [Crocinitomicaceae bacterium]
MILTTISYPLDGKMMRLIYSEVFLVLSAQGAGKELLDKTFQGQTDEGVG